MTTNSLKICVVVAEYYEDIAKNLIKGANIVLDKHKTFKHDKLKPSSFDWGEDLKSSLTLERAQIVVPGVFELPGMIAKFIDKYHAFIALGCVIKGETPHFDFVSSSCANGLTRVSLDSNKPVLFGVLTTETQEQAIQRADPDKGNKGAEVAQSAMELLEQLASNDSS